MANQCDAHLLGESGDLAGLLSHSSNVSNQCYLNTSVAFVINVSDSARKTPKKADRCMHEANTDTNSNRFHAQTHYNILVPCLHRRRSICRQPRREGLRIPRLHEHCARPCELTDQALTCRHVRHDTAGYHTLEDVLAVPRDEVAVVDDVLFVLGELLHTYQHFLSDYKAVNRGR